MDALSAGCDSSSLVQLAGMDARNDPSIFEAPPLFRSSLKELRFSIPSTQNELLRAFLVWIAGEIVAERVAPLDALERVHAEIVSPLNHPSDLMDWCHLWERHDPRSYAELNDDAVAELTRRLAQTTASGS